MTIHKDLVDLLKYVMSIFYDKKNNFSVSKFLIFFFLITVAMLHYKWDSVSVKLGGFIHSVSKEKFIEDLKEKRALRLEESIKAQVHSTYLQMKPDSVSLFLYRPEGDPNYAEIVRYEGNPPEGMTYEDWSLVGVDRTSDQFIRHNKWVPDYTSYEVDPTVDSHDKLEDYKTKWQYTCPLYSLDTVYFGYLQYNWNTTPEGVKTDYKDFMQKLYTSCTFAARKIGVHKVISTVDGW